MSWRLERLVGRAGELHDREVSSADAGAIWWLDATAPALVLGSTQRWDSVDHDVAARRGVDVVRRRSGGGAVYVAAGTLTWVDIILGREDPRWSDDVGRSFDWLGSAWVAALAALGISGATAHPGPMLGGPWSSLVCFGGLGPGEVVVTGRKLVGISQRRTRAGARFQCAVLHRWAPADVLDLVALGGDDRARATAELADVAVGLDGLGAGGIGGAAVVGALADALGSADLS